MKYPLICIVLIAFLLNACSGEQKPLTFTEMSSGQLFDRYKKNVVLIKNRSYFKITFNDKNVLYATSLGSEGGYITLNEEEAKEKAEENYGTGFFIGKKGMIATNFHVIAPINSLLEDISIKETVIEALHASRDITLDDLSWEISAYISHYNDSGFLKITIPERLLSLLDISTKAATEYYDSASVYRSRIDSLVKTFTLLEDVTTKDFLVSVQTAGLTITMDASTGNTKEYSCHIYSVTDDSHADLALIQTNDEEIPDGAEGNLDLYSKDTAAYRQTILPWDTLKVTTPLFLISYNYGEAIAKTADGLKVQLTQGNVSQENDKYRVLYSIPALPGSSGGPVFNKIGQLVAINYSGFGQQGNFNYGILSFQLKRLVEKPPSLNIII